MNTFVSAAMGTAGAYVAVCVVRKLGIAPRFLSSEFYTPLLCFSYGFIVGTERYRSNTKADKKPPLP